MSRRRALQLAFLLIFAATVSASALLWMGRASDLRAQTANIAPVFPPRESGVRVIPEGAEADRAVGPPVAAVDHDSVELAYSLTGADAADFTIDAATGQILTSSPLSYASKGSYSVMVEVSDGADGSGAEDPAIDATIAVTIRVSVAVDLNDWTAEHYASATDYCDSGAWSVASDGSSARERRGRAPSMLYGNFDAVGKRLTATLIPGRDDDFVGFVVGFNAGDTANADADYLLIDWKHSRQSWDFAGASTSRGGAAEGGLRLSRVRGIPDCDEFWQHANLSGTPDGSGVEELQLADTLGNRLYAHTQHYEFAIDFGSSDLAVYVDGKLELSLEGDFISGSFGAYAMLHDSAIFRNVSYSDGSFPTVVAAIDQPGSVTLSTTQPVVGASLTATLSDPDGSISDTVWQWERSPDQAEPVWTTITGASSNTYTPVSADASKLLRASVSYTDALASGRTAVSPATSAVDQPGSVTLSTTQPVAGVSLTASLSDADGSISSQVWQWERSPNQAEPVWTTITGASSNVYIPVAADAGMLLRASVSYTDTLASGRTTVSTATSAVDQPGSVTLSTTQPVVGASLTATLSDADGSISNTVWQWEKSPNQSELMWTTIAEASSNTYTSVADDAGKLLRASVAYADSLASGRSAVSRATSAVKQADQPGSVTLSTTQPVLGASLTATLSDADGSISSQVWQWESSPSGGSLVWTTITGAQSATYTPVSADAGKLLRASVSYTDALASDRTAVSPTTSPVDQPGSVTLSTSQPVVGVSLTATLSDADGSISSQAWQWESSPSGGSPVWTAITGAQSATYTPVAADAGKLLRASVSYADALASDRTAVSPATSPVDRPGSVTLSTTQPVAGVSLTASLSDADGSISSQVWQWESSPSGGSPDWTTITGAQSSTYTPVAADAGKLLRASVAYTDALASGRSSVSPATSAVDQPGSVTLSTAQPVVGESLTASLSDADGSISNKVWQWERSPSGGSPIWTTITGAQSATYTPVSADAGKLLRASVSYTDALASGRTAVSPATSAVGQPSQDQPGLVTLSTSQPVVGESLTATLSDADGSISSQVWQWERSPSGGSPIWTTITGAQSATYTPVSADAGKLLRASVSYTDALASNRTAVSPATSAVGQSSQDQPGSVTLSSSQPVVGESLTATLSDADGSISNKVWQWERSPNQLEPVWTTITGAQSATYTPVSADAGKLLRASVAYTDALASGRTAVSPATSAVGQPSQDQPGSVTLSSSQPVVGTSLTATLSDADGSISDETWQWEISPSGGSPVWTAITGAQSATYTPVSADAGKLLRASVSYTDALASGRTAISPATSAVGQPSQDQPGSVTLSSSQPVVGTSLTATLSDADGSISSQVWQWEKSPNQADPVWTTITGAQSATYTPVATDAGKLLRALVSYTDALASGRTAVSSATSAVGQPSQDQPGSVTLSSSQPVVGVSLTATLSDADGGISSQVWQWESSPNQAEPVWTTITRASSNTYTPISADAGKLLRASVSYTDALASGRSAVSPATSAIDQPGRVSLSTTQPVVGASLTATLSDADGDISSQVWQWQRSSSVGSPVWTVIVGAQSATYTPVAADAGKLLRASVSYTDALASGRTAVSPTTSTVKQADQLGSVTLSTSQPVVGVSLTASLSDADGSISDEVWQWQSSPNQAEPVWTTITGAQSATYTPVAADAGKLLRASVSYTDTLANGRSAVSPATSAVDQSGSVTLSTTQPVVGASLTATLSDADGSISNKVWQWERSPSGGSPDWTTITGAQSATYTPVSADAGKLLRASVAYTDALASGRSAVSPATSAVGQSSQDQPGSVTLSSSQPVVGVSLTATLSDADGSISSQVWQWERSPSVGSPVWTVIVGAQSATYTPVAANAGKLLRASVSYTDALASGRTAVSPATSVVDQPGSVTLSTAQPVVGESLTASLSDADGGISSQVWHWQRSPDQSEPVWTVISGASSNVYTPVAADAGKLLRASVSYADALASGRSAVSPVTSAVDQPGSVTLSTAQPMVGESLTASLSDADGSISNKVWQWESSPSGGSPVWTTITGAQSATYTPASAGAGMLLRASVSYADALASGRSAVSPATSAVDQPGRVTLSTAQPVVGESLTASLSDADGGISDQVWQWQGSPNQAERVWTTITGAQSATYAPVSADAGKLLRASVSYADALASGRTAVSLATSAVKQADQPGSVTLSTSQPVVAASLTATLSDANGGISNKAWQWESSPSGESPVWTTITGAQSATYTPVAADAGKLLRASVSYTDALASGRTTVSTATSAVDQPGRVTLSTAQPVVGESLTATLSDADGSISSQAWQWERSPSGGSPIWTTITGAQSATYTPASTDAGKLLRASVSYTDALASGRSAVSPATSAVKQADRPGSVTLSTTNPAVGESLTASLNDPDGSVSNEVWQWERSPNQAEPVWTAIPEAQSSTYTPEADDAGMLLRASVSYADALASGRFAVSPAMSVVDQPGQKEVDAPYLPSVAVEAAGNRAPAFLEGDETTRTIEEGVGIAQAGSPIRATDPDHDSLGYWLTGKNTAFFGVDRASGQISSTVSMARQGGNTYWMTMHVSDFKGGMDSIQVAITVMRVDAPFIDIGNEATGQAPSGTSPFVPAVVVAPQGGVSSSLPSGEDEATTSADAEGEQAHATAGPDATESAEGVEASADGGDTETDSSKAVIVTEPAEAQDLAQPTDISMGAPMADAGDPSPETPTPKTILSSPPPLTLSTTRTTSASSSAYTWPLLILLVSLVAIMVGTAMLLYG